MAQDEPDVSRADSMARPNVPALFRLTRCAGPGAAGCRPRRMGVILKAAVPRQGVSIPARALTDGGADKGDLYFEVTAAAAQHQVEAQADPLAPAQGPFEILRHEVRGFFAAQHGDASGKAQRVNQVSSRQRRRLIRARCRMTQQLAVEMESSRQISSVSSSRNSRIMKTRDVRSGR